jgi:DNA-binding NtrC family response regulator
MKIKRLLIIEDDSTLKTALFRALTRFGYAVTTASSKSEASTWLGGQTAWDAILLDLQLPDGTGMEILAEIKRKSSRTPVIVLTGHGSVENAVMATQRGAFNFLVKPISLDDVISSLKAALEQNGTPLQSSTAEIIPPTRSTSTAIVGQSQEIHYVLDLVTRVADSDATILIQGESGTGKELIARAIHQLSPRKNAPFIAINCGAIPSELLESELFGHVKGAFSGAIANRVGRFEMADGGILFLDEIGDMSPSLQVKILRALQERSFEPVGSTKSVHVNVQVIAATHVNLEKAVTEGQFREDLYYRLNVIPITVPALRERKTDIPILIQHFLKAFSGRRRETIAGFAADAVENLMNYPWPGNIRELENLVERLTIIKGRGLVELKDLPPKYHVKMSTVHTPAIESPRTFELPIEGLDFNAAVDQFENNLIMKALEKTGWNRNQAAMLLKLNRTTLVEKMKKKGLRPPDELMTLNGEDSTPLALTENMNHPTLG